MKINKYILQQRQQRWNNNENNKLLEIKPTLGKWKQSFKKTLKRGGYIVQTLDRSYKDNTLLFTQRKTTNVLCMSDQIHREAYLIKCTYLAHIRKTFYSANSMKELFQNTEINNVISFLKTEVIHKNLKKFTIRPNYFYKPFLY